MNLPTATAALAAGALEPAFGAAIDVARQEVPALAAVLGGIDPFGGFGKVGGLLLALIILQVIASAFNLLNLSQFLTLAIWGGILIAVAAVPHFAGKVPR